MSNALEPSLILLHFFLVLGLVSNFFFFQFLFAAVRFCCVSTRLWPELGSHVEYWALFKITVISIIIWFSSSSQNNVGDTEHSIVYEAQHHRRWFSSSLQNTDGDTECSPVYGAQHYHRWFSSSLQNNDRDIECTISLQCSASSLVQQLIAK